MADIVLPVVGGAVGFVLGGPSGAILGANLGGMAAGAFFAKTQRIQLPTQEGPRLADLRAQTSTYGNMISKVYGTMRLSGNVIWATDIKEVKTEKTSTQTSSGGGKGGGGGKTTTSQTTVTYEYFITLAIAIYDGKNLETYKNGALIDKDAVLQADESITGGYIFNDDTSSAQRSFMGWISDILIFDSVLRTADRKLVEACLIQKRGII